MTEPLYRLEGVAFRYPNTAAWSLLDLNLVLPRGCICAVIGPNGAGKSTLLQLLGRRLRPTRGRIYYRDRPLDAVPPHQWPLRVAWLPQRPQVHFPVPVRYLARLGRWPRRRTWFDADADPVIDRVLQTLGLHHLADRPVTELSGGEQQLAHMARALAQEPETLLLDEPLTHLDFRHTVRFLDKLRELVETGLSVVMVAHDLNMVAHYADWVVLLHDGRVLADGPPVHVLTYPNLKAAFGTEVYIDVNDLTGRLIILPLPAHYIHHSQNDSRGPHRMGE